MDFKALGERVHVPEGYDLRVSDLDDLYILAAERSIAEAFHMAFLAGWQKRENKAKNDARRAAHQG